MDGEGEGEGKEGKSPLRRLREAGDEGIPSKRLASRGRPSGTGRLRVAGSTSHARHWP